MLAALHNIQECSVRSTLERCIPDSFLCHAGYFTFWVIISIIWGLVSAALPSP